MSAPPVVVEDLRVELSVSGAVVVDEVSFEIRAGEVLGLVGESGCGKTTVGMALLGHCRRGARVVGGAIRIDDRDIVGADPAQLHALRGRVVSYIPQDPPSALNPVLRIGTQLREVLEAHLPEWTAAQRDERVREVLDEVVLPSDAAFLRRYPHQLSGGQQQRLVIAMAFACRPNVIVCDEPTTGLDVTTQGRVLETVRALCREHGVAALYVSHDLAVVATLADRVAVMYGGRIVETGSRDQLFHSARHPYTRRLLLAAPDLAGRQAPVGIAGHAPLPGEARAGCSFAPRCPAAIDRCRTVLPPPIVVAEGHEAHCHRAGERLDVVPAAAGTTLSGTTGGELVLDVRSIVAAHGSQRILHDVSIDLRSHECLALVGESGSGKTTLARCIAGLHREFSGAVELRGVPLAPSARSRSAQARREVQYVFQNPYASLNPRRTVGQSVAVPLRLFFGLKGKEADRRVAEALERVALSSKTAERFPDQLSGGERQRAAIARALAAEPSVLVCDEVTSALDVSVQAAIIELLGTLQQEMGLSLLFITHNLALIRTIADRVAVMSAGRIVELGDTASLFRAPEAAYTRELLAHTPSIQLDAAAPTGAS